MATMLQPAGILDRLAAILPPDALLTGEEDRSFYGTDVYRAGKPPLAVALPDTIDRLQAVVRACAETRTPLAVRGGGASYTDGYTHAAPRGLTISTERLARIVEIDETDATVTVEPGVTWAALHAALAERGWRTPFFGPFSGLVATVGGAISQNAVSHGTGSAGVSAESLLALEIITGTGELLKTGSAGSAVADPFFRHFGPDLAGLFTGDCGALGVKARITLKLQRVKPHTAYVSFRFETFERLHAALQAIAAERLDDEHFAVDAQIQRAQLERASSAGAKMGIAKQVMDGSGSFLDGAKKLAKMALAGEKELALAPYAAHWITDGISAAEADDRAARIRALAGPHGSEMPATVPTVTRAVPFQPLTNTLGARGERWVPIHGIFPMSRVLGFHHALQHYWRANAGVLEAHGIHSGTMFMALGPSAFLYEPTFNWPDARHIYHERVVPPGYLAKLPVHAANPAAMAEVKRMKSEVADLMAAHGSAHFQIGKFYPYARGRNPAALALLRAIKAALDPHNILNPGALGI
jgi:D-lactate dehydrogenase (cytochrome)